jgi:hypothetical protein
VQLFHLPFQGVSMRSPGNADDAGLPMIAQNGSYVPSLFDYLLRQDRGRFDAATEALKGLIPGLSAINVGTPQPEERRLDLVLDEGLRLPADRASTGVRMLLAFVALAHHPMPPRVILLEEPENGVHPKRLEEIVRLLREITEGKHGAHASQVILTTHSPYLLDYVSLETDQVLVFRRNPDGSRTAEPADPERLQIFRDEFQLGEIWYNQGEEGMVAKKRRSTSTSSATDRATRRPCLGSLRASSACRCGLGFGPGRAFIFMQKRATRPNSGSQSWPRKAMTCRESSPRWTRTSCRTRARG